MGNPILDDLVVKINEDIRNRRVTFDKVHHKAVESLIIDGRMARLCYGSIVARLMNDGKEIEK